MQVDKMADDDSGDDPLLVSVVAGLQQAQTMVRELRSTRREVTKLRRQNEQLRETLEYYAQTPVVGARAKAALLAWRT